MFQYKIPFTPFPSDIFVDTCGQSTEEGFAKSIFAKGGQYARFAKQSVVTADNRCLEYAWSYWAKLVDESNGIRRYRLGDVSRGPAAKLALPE